jgi:1-acyl-sn-glycerol-3-phosphate acyltransferase
MRILWGPLNILQWSLIAAWTALWTTLALLLVAVSRRPAIGLAMARRVWAPGMHLWCMARLRVEGAERLSRDRPWFIASNHTSFGDIPVLFWALPIDLRFVAKRELRRVPFMGWYMAGMGMVFIDRGRRSSGAASVEAVASVLRAGDSVVSFPAGTRRQPGEPQRFKSAAFAAALQVGVPVVPVAVHGSASVQPPGSWRLRPGTVHVRVGEPIATQGLTLAERDGLAGRVEAAVGALLAELQQPAPGS